MPVDVIPQLSIEAVQLSTDPLNGSHHRRMIVTILFTKHHQKGGDNTANRCHQRSQHHPPIHHAFDAFQACTASGTASPAT